MAPSSRKKPVEADDGGGAPEWMVTFCDCMTLLLTFFVLLLSFATFHKETMPRLGVSFSEALPALGLSRNEQRDSLWDKMSSDETVRQKEGSETRTSDTTQSSNFMREKRALDFRNLKVFSAPSEAFFLGARGGDFQPGHAGARCLGGFSSLSASAGGHQRKRAGRQCRVGIEPGRGSPELSGRTKGAGSEIFQSDRIEYDA